MFDRGTTSPTLTYAIRLWLALLVLAVLIGGLVLAQIAMAQDAEPTCNLAGDDNDLLYCVWIAEPRFGGMSVDQSDASVLRVLLTGDDPTDPAADRVLGEVNRLWDRDFTDTTVTTADYTVGQLKGWFDTVAADFHEQMTGVDLDEAANRVAVMVADTGDATAVREHLAALGLPTRVLDLSSTIAAVSHLRQAMGSSSPGSGGKEMRLNQNLNPIVGGGRITSRETTPNGGWCTMTVGVAFTKDNGEHEEGFITAGHCGDAGTNWEMDYSGVGRQRIGSSELVLPHPSIDAQYVNYRGPDEIAMGVGYIAGPLLLNTDGVACDEVMRLNPDDLYFEVSGIKTDLVVGDPVHKVGATSGWTSGLITKTCVFEARLIDSADWACGYDQASYAGWPGDSGAPVFVMDPEGTVSLVGINIGGRSGQAHFARMQLVMDQLFHAQGFTQVNGDSFLPTGDLPTLLDFAITSDPRFGSSYLPGETLQITYMFSEPVVLYPGLQPSVTFLVPGGKYRVARYDAERSTAAGDDKLVFTWEVESGFDGELWIGQGVPELYRSIGDLGGNLLVPTELEYGRSAQIGQKSGNPTMQWGGFSNEPLNGSYYQPGETIEVTTRWDRPVQVENAANAPYVEISMWPRPGWARATYDPERSASAGLDKLVFTYTVQPADSDDSGIWIGAADGDNPYRGYTSLENQDGIIDYSGRSPNDDWPTDGRGHDVGAGGTATITEVNVTSTPLSVGRYQPGEDIVIELAASKPLKVDEYNPPFLRLVASYDGTYQTVDMPYDAGRTAELEHHKLAFGWTVANGYTDDNGFALTNISLLNTTGVTDYAGVTIDAWLPFEEAVRQLGDNHKVGDSGAPSIADVEFTSRPAYGGTYQPGEVIEITLTASEPVRVTGGRLPHIQMRVKNRYPRANYDSVHTAATGCPDRLVFTWIVQDGYSDDDGFLIAPDYFRNTTGVTDWSGNPINVTLPGYWGDDPRHKVWDLGAPVITDLAITSSPASVNTYSSGETIEITLTANEPLTVPTGQEPRLVVEVGSQYPTFRYDRGRSQAAGGNHLVFTWTVGHGYQDDDGILGLPDSLRDAGSVVDWSGNILAANLHQYRFFGGHRVDAGANPGRPAQLTATVGNGKVTLIWRDPGNRYITHYRYRQSTDGGTTWELLGQSQQGWFDIPGSGPATTSYAVPNLIWGTEYTFQIVAINASGGGGWSEASYAVVATPRNPLGPPSIQYMNRESDGIYVAWTAPDDDGGAGNHRVRPALHTGQQGRGGGLELDPG